MEINTLSYVLMAVGFTGIGIVLYLIYKMGAIEYGEQKSMGKQ